MRGIAARELLEDGQHPILIESSVSEVCVGVVAYLELTGRLCRGSVDPDRGETVQVITALIGINDVDGLVSAFKAVLDERQQHAVFLFVAVEERAHVARIAERRAGQGDWFRIFLHDAHVPTHRRAVQRFRTG
jgi:hypothetical protein